MGFTAEVRVTVVGQGVGADRVHRGEIFDFLDQLAADQLEHAGLRDRGAARPRRGVELDGGGQRFEAHFEFDVSPAEPVALAQRHAGLVHLLADGANLGQAAAVFGDPRQAEPLELEQRLGDGPAGVLFAHPVFDRHSHIVEEHLIEQMPAVDADDRTQADPGCFMSTSRKLMPSCLRASVSVRTRQKIQSACCAYEVQILLPLTSFLTPVGVWRIARVATAARSDPALGSE